MFQQMPFEIIEVTEETKGFEHRIQHFPNAVQVGPKKYYMSGKYKGICLDIHNFQARADDVWLFGFPRSGTTLHCEMIWQIANDLDFEGAAKTILDLRFPHIDTQLLHDNLMGMQKRDDADTNTKRIIEDLSKLCVKRIDETPGKRFIKCHLPISLAPPQIFEVGSKVIYCARNPKDVIVSFYNAFKFFTPPEQSHNMTYKKVFDGFKNNVVCFSPYFEHLKEAWARRNDENFLFIFYEDTVKDKRPTMRKIAEFLGKSLSNDQIEALEDHLGIDKFKKNRSVNLHHFAGAGAGSKGDLFIGKGGAGGWKRHFSEELEKEIDEWIAEGLKGTDIKFPKLI